MRSSLPQEKNILNRMLSETQLKGLAADLGVPEVLGCATRRVRELIGRPEAAGKSMLKSMQTKGSGGR